MDIALEPATSKALEDLYEAIRNEDRSTEAFALAGNVIEAVNSAEYSAWEWRWKCLMELIRDKDESVWGPLVDMERALMRRVATANPKNYQLWNHRRKLTVHCLYELKTDEAGLLAGELDFTAGCLQVDTKNYHAWAHRQAVIRMFAKDASVMQREFEFVEQLLSRDVLNNSAWSQRAFLVEILRKEANKPFPWHIEYEFTIQRIREFVENEASWAYLAYVVRNGVSVVGDIAPDGSSRLLNRHEEFLGNMLGAHPTSIEVGSAVFAHFKDLRDKEKDEHERARLVDSMLMLRDRLVELDHGRRASRWDVWL